MHPNNGCSCALHAALCTRTNPIATYHANYCAVGGKHNLHICVVQNGEKSRHPGEFDCPPGWSWEDEWTVDDNRAVDDQGEGSRLIIYMKCSVFITCWKCYKIVVYWHFFILKNRKWCKMAYMQYDSPIKHLQLSKFILMDNQYFS